MKRNFILNLYRIASVLRSDAARKHVRVTQSDEDDLHGENRVAELNSAPRSF